MKISVIIPTLNEGSTLRNALLRLKRGMNLELIVVDGGSRDDTVAIAREFTRKVFLSSPGRARQMNEGAREAEGDVLLFLHADSILSQGSIGKIVPTLSRFSAVGGAFSLAFESRSPFLKLVSLFANLRTKMTRVPYGDQGIFLFKETFRKIGGYPDVPIMEDVLLALKVKKEGRIVLLKERIFTSSRRWEKEGYFSTTLRNRALMAGFILGLSPDRLASCHRNLR